jgi:hypothetical protein
MQKTKTDFMKLKQLLFFGLLLISRLINAQTDFRSGFIIKANSDTLFGEIDYRGDLLMAEKCRFRKDNKGIEINYSPGDVVAFRFNESKYFISKEVNGKKVFLEFLIKGLINVYYLRDTNGDHYFLEKEGMGITEIPYEEEIRYYNDTTYLYKSTKYIGILKLYMQDAPEFQSRINTMGKPEHDNLIKLAEDYHNKVCKNGPCMIYEKKLPPLKIDLEIIGGTVNYQNTDIFTNKHYFQTGILALFWMPRTSEKLFFRTGILYSTPESNVGKNSIYKIPLQLEYIYPKGIVRPKFAYGITFYKPLDQSVSLMGGLNIKLNNSLFLTTNYDIDCNQTEVPFFPKSIVSQSFSIGLLIKL